MSAWKPGDVAALEIGGERVRGVVVASESERPVWQIAGHTYFKTIAVGNNALIDNARPLVVIDPEDAEQVERLHTLLDGPLADLADVLREFADPKPRIEEPTNWLSVIRDNEGIEWYRWSVRPRDRDQAWVSAWDEGRCYPTDWDDIHAVEIVSAGIELAE